MRIRGAGSIRAGQMFAGYHRALRQVRVARTLLTANAASMGLSVEKNRDPVHSSRIHGIARIAGTNSKLPNSRIAQQWQRTSWQRFWMTLGVGHYLAEAIGSRQQMGIRTILFCQLAGGFIQIRRRDLPQFLKAGLLADVIDGAGN